MGAVILRAQTCLICSGPMPIKSRVDRRYCKDACKTLAYRVRQRVKAYRPPGPLEPEWAEPNAVVETMLTSLAQIQARVLDFAHQLEHEELYSRLPVRTEGGESADASSKSVTEELGASHKQQVDDLAREAEDRAVLPALRLELERAKEDAVKALQRAETAEKRASVLHADLAHLREELRQSSALKSAELSQSLQLSSRLDEVAQQRDKIQAELVGERERTGKLEAQLKNQNKEANDVLGQLKSQRDHLQRNSDILAAHVRDLEAQLQRANESLVTWEKAGAESMALASRSSTLQRENAVLRAEVERLRPPSTDSDSLVLLMRERVKALHWLAVYETRAGRKVTGQFLPSYDNEQIMIAAEHQAFAARRDFYFRTRWPHEAKPQWIFEDRLLDPVSEKKVHDDEQFKNRSVFSRLESARRYAGELP